MFIYHELFVPEILFSFGPQLITYRSSSETKIFCTYFKISNSDEQPSRLHYTFINSFQFFLYNLLSLDFSWHSTLHGPFLLVLSSNFYFDLGTSCLSSKCLYIMGFWGFSFQKIPIFWPHSLLFTLSDGKVKCSVLLFQNFKILINILVDWV